MKYIINILIITVISLMATGVAACSNGTHKENAEKTSDSNASEESATNQMYTIERVYRIAKDSTLVVDGKYPLIAAQQNGLVLRDSSGKLLRFDNDADYLEFIPTISFISNSFRSNTCTKMLGISIHRNNWDWARANKDKFYETNAFVWDYDHAIINGVIDYLQGHKEKISDPVILEEIERTFYDTHPTEAGVRLSESKYNYKNYEVEGSLSITAKPFESHTYDIGILGDGTEIPAGTLVFTDWFF